MMSINISGLERFSYYRLQMSVLLYVCRRSLSFLVKLEQLDLGNNELEVLVRQHLILFCPPADKSLCHPEEKNNQMRPD